MRAYHVWILAGFLLEAAGVLLAGEPANFDEYKVKRAEIFEFVQAPAVTRSGDRIEIAFETKAGCDVTVAVEDTDGRIVRHLASGVLGKNAPPPFQKDSLKQKIVWDGKDDEGKYIDDKDAHTVRMSLGLKAEYERALYSDPRKRIGFSSPRLAATPEGVYVFEGRGVDFLRLYGHDGAYQRTVYPFPADKLKDVNGAAWRELPGIGRWPLKFGYQQATLLTSGCFELHRKAVEGDPALTYANREHHREKGSDLNRDGKTSALALAVAGNRIAIADICLNRLQTDGSTGGLALTGPRTCLNMQDFTRVRLRNQDTPLSPTSLALSPDGKTCYLTGYLATAYVGTTTSFAAHAVMKLDFESDGQMAVFAGSLKVDDYGKDNAHLAAPTSVACDASGRVYVSDYGNHRIQVFAPDGKCLKSIPVPTPAKVMLHAKTGEIWVCSFPCFGLSNDAVRKDPVLLQASAAFAWGGGNVNPVLYRFESFENPRKLSQVDLPEVVYGNTRETTHDQLLQVELDSWSAQPALWTVGRRTAVSQADIIAWGAKKTDEAAGQWEQAGIRIMTEQGGKWTVTTDFAKEAARTVARLKPWDNGIQRLRVNPATGRVYVLEQEGPRKSARELIEADPETGKVREVPIPFRAEDFCFDIAGRIYLRTDHEVARYDARTWREVPWDYGEERKVGFDGPPADTIAALPIPGSRPMWFHMDGMSVSPRGRLAVMCPNEPKRFQERDRNMEKWKGEVAENKAHYKPPIYPGRYRFGEVHVWDRHGQMVYEDAIPGIGILDGVFIDNADDLYVMAQSVRRTEGVPYPNGKTGTLMKFEPKKARILSSWSDPELMPTPLPEDSTPNRPKDLYIFWAEGAQWFFGGVGHAMRSTGGCNCWHARFALDYYARSFAPECERYSVAVLDSAGNLITRLGSYGNADDEGVRFVYPSFVDTQTDRRLFVADQGNGRIASIKLSYNSDARIVLKDVPDSKQ